LRAALRKGDKSLLGVVLNVLLAWPECAFRDEMVRHPHTRAQLAYQPAVFRDGEVMPKEARLIELAREEKRRGAGCWLHGLYRHARYLGAAEEPADPAGLKVAVLRRRWRPQT